MVKCRIKIATAGPAARSPGEEMADMAEPTRARPKPTPETQHFWDGTQAGELRLQRCDACANVYFPPPQFFFPAAPFLPGRRLAQGQHVKSQRQGDALQLRHHPSTRRTRFHAALR